MRESRRTIIVRSAATKALSSLSRAWLCGQDWGGEARAAPAESSAYARLFFKSMPARGKFIVLEGIDGSGKRTQLETVGRAFMSRGIAFTQVSFPRYDGFFGKLVAASSTA